MRLPNAESAEVPIPKVRDYLLDPQHHVGAAKSRFLHRLGFTQMGYADLIMKLREIAKNNPVVATRQTPYGTNYRIDGELSSKGGLRGAVTTIWTIDAEGTVPRFVTLYPNNERPNT